MILPDCQIPALANLNFEYTGIDHPARCLDPQHFTRYPYPISYHYNDRGFRDATWPGHDLDQAIWCLGDSFTVGLGSPLSHTWPRQLALDSGLRSINVSRDGASNDWISRQAVSILREIQPRYLCIMWSYLHRRENTKIDAAQFDRRLHHDYTSYQEDLLNFITNIQAVQSEIKQTLVVMTAVPRAFIDPLAAVFDLWRDLADPSWGAAPLTDHDVAQLPQYIQHEMVDLHHCWDRYQDLRLYHNRFLATVPMGADLLKFPEIVKEIHQLDTARDGHHFDLVTARAVVELMTRDLGLMPAVQAS